MWSGLSHLPFCLSGVLDGGVRTTSKTPPSSPSSCVLGWVQNETDGIFLFDCLPVARRSYGLSVPHAKKGLYVET